MLLLLLFGGVNIYQFILPFIFFIKKRNLIECLTHTRYLEALRVEDKTYHLAGHVQALSDVSLTHQIVSSIISYSCCSSCHPEVLDCNRLAVCLLFVARL